jgi:hypothetical protein
MMSSVHNKKAVVFDWDWSAVNDNTDTWVPQSLSADVLAYIHSNPDKLQWTALMAEAARRLHKAGVSR